MKQFDVDETMKVQIDYTDTGIPRSVRLLQPVVFQEGNSYCVVLGPDQTVGVVGCGPTLSEALWDWDKHLEDFKRNHEEDDEVALFIESRLTNSTETDEMLAATGTDEYIDTPEIPFETPHAKGLA
jgi:hypothetical protein